MDCFYHEQCGHKALTSTVLLVCNCLVGLCQDCARKDVLICLSLERQRRKVLPEKAATNTPSYDAFYSCPQCREKVTTKLHDVLGGVEEALQAEENLLRKAMTKAGKAYDKHNTNEFDLRNCLARSKADLSLTDLRLVTQVNEDEAVIVAKLRKQIVTMALEQFEGFANPYECITFTKNRFYRSSDRPNYQQSEDYVCIVCQDSVQAGHSVQLTCSCNYIVCRTCALINAHNRQDTFINGVYCSWCTVPSRGVYANTDTVLACETALIHSATHYLSTKLLTSRGDTERNNLLTIIRMYWCLGYKGNIDFFSKAERNAAPQYSVPRLRLEVAKLEEHRLNRCGLIDTYNIRYSAEHGLIYKNNDGTSSSANRITSIHEPSAGKYPIGFLHALHVAKNTFFEHYYIPKTSNSSTTTTGNQWSEQCSKILTTLQNASAASSDKTTIDLFDKFIIHCVQHSTHYSATTTTMTSSYSIRQIAALLDNFVSLIFTVYAPFENTIPTAYEEIMNEFKISIMQKVNVVRSVQSSVKKLVQLGFLQSEQDDLYSVNLEQCSSVQMDPAMTEPATGTITRAITGTTTCSTTGIATGTTTGTATSTAMNSSGDHDSSMSLNTYHATPSSTTTSTSTDTIADITTSTASSSHITSDRATIYDTGTVSSSTTVSSAESPTLPQLHIHAQVEELDMIPPIRLPSPITTAPTAVVLHLQSELPSVVPAIPELPSAPQLVAPPTLPLAPPQVLSVLLPASPLPAPQLAPPPAPTPPTARPPLPPPRPPSGPVPSTVVGSAATTTTAAAITNTVASTSSSPNSTNVAAATNAVTVSTSAASRKTTTSKSRRTAPPMQQYGAPWMPWLQYAYTTDYNNTYNDDYNYYGYSSVLQVAPRPPPPPPLPPPPPPPPPLPTPVVVMEVVVHEFVPQPAAAPIEPSSVPTPVPTPSAHTAPAPAEEVVMQPESYECNYFMENSNTPEIPRVPSAPLLAVALGPVAATPADAPVTYRIGPSRVMLRLAQCMTQDSSAEPVENVSQCDHLHQPPTTPARLRKRKGVFPYPISTDDGANSDEWDEKDAHISYKKRKSNSELEGEVTKLSKGQRKHRALLLDVMRQEHQRNTAIEQAEKRAAELQATLQTLREQADKAFQNAKEARAEQDKLRRELSTVRTAAQNVRAQRQHQCDSLAQQVVALKARLVLEKQAQEVSRKISVAAREAQIACTPETVKNAPEVEERRTQRGLVNLAIGDERRAKHQLEKKYSNLLCDINRTERIIGDKERSRKQTKRNGEGPQDDLAKLTNELSTLRKKNTVELTQREQEIDQLRQTVAALDEQASENARKNPNMHNTLAAAVAHEEAKTKRLVAERDALVPKCADELRRLNKILVYMQPKRREMNEELDLAVSLTTEKEEILEEKHELLELARLWREQQQAEKLQADNEIDLLMSSMP